MNRVVHVLLRSCLTLFLLQVAAGGCGTSFGNPAASPLPDGIDPAKPNIERSTRTVDFAGVSTLRVDIPLGSLTLTQTSEGAPASLHVTETIVAFGRFPGDLKRMLYASSLVARRSFVDDSRLELSAEISPDLNDSDIAFDVVLAIPAGVPTQIVLGRGAVAVTGLAANIEIVTSQGAVTARDIVGNLAIQTSEEPVEVTSINGNISATTSGAGIAIRTARDSNGAIQAHTIAGRILLSIPATAAATLDLEALEGTVSANLSPFSVSNLTTSGYFVRGALNGGGAAIEARTTGADIIFGGL